MPSTHLALEAGLKNTTGEKNPTTDAFLVQKADLSAGRVTGAFLAPEVTSGLIQRPNDYDDHIFYYSNRGTFDSEGTF
jgi:hypothetical protein